MKKYLIPASITAVAVGAFLVFQNAGYVQTVQLSTWRPVADLTAWPGTTKWPAFKNDAGADAIGSINIPPEILKAFDRCEYRMKFSTKAPYQDGYLQSDSYLYPTKMVASEGRLSFLEFSTKDGWPFDFHKIENEPYTKLLSLYLKTPENGSTGQDLQISLHELSPPPPPVQYPITKDTVFHVISKPKNPVKLGENIESVILESRCYMRHRSSVLDDEAKSVVRAKIGNES